MTAKGLVAALLLALAGCQHVPATGDPLAADKALFAAEAGYAGAAAAIEAASDQGLLHDRAAARAAEALRAAYQALLLARAAAKAGDAGNARARADAVLSATGQAEAAIQDPTP
jgi:hypothetical protein